MSIIGEYTQESWMPDSVVDELSQFPIPDFQAAIKFWLANVEDDGRNFWYLVIFRASKGRVAGISDGQKPYLKAWIKSNWFWFTESFSKRQQIELQRKLELLDAPS